MDRQPNPAQPRGEKEAGALQGPPATLEALSRDGKWKRSIHAAYRRNYLDRLTARIPDDEQVVFVGFDTSFNSVVVFTDKAVYTMTLTLSRTMHIERILYERIKAVYTKTNHFNQNELTTWLRLDREMTGYNHVKVDFGAGTGLARKIVESILHEFSPVAMQRSGYAGKRGAKQERGKDGEFIVPAKIMDLVHAQRRNLVNRTRAGYGTLIALLGLSIIFAAAPPYSPLIAVGWTMLIFVSSILVACSANTSGPGYWSIQPLTRYILYPVASHIIKVEEDGIACTFTGELPMHPRRGKGVPAPFWIPFHEGMTISIDQSKSFAKKRAVIVASPANPRQPFMLGPVTDPFALYYAIREKFEAWLEKRGYFVKSSEIFALVEKDMFLTVIASKLHDFMPEKRTIPGREANKLAREAIKQSRAISLPEPLPIEEMAGDLLFPPDHYREHVEAGELVHASFRSFSRKKLDQEYLLTTKKTIVADTHHVRSVPHASVILLTGKLENPDADFLLDIVLHMNNPGIFDSKELVLDDIPARAPFLAVLEMLVRRKIRIE